MADMTDNPDLQPAAGLVPPITSIPNLGPASAAAFLRVGITSAEQLRALGADAAYSQLLQAGVAPHFIGYYVLVMGLQGRPWNDCQGDEKKALREKFDALKAAAHDKDQTEFERALDRLGVVERKPGTTAVLPTDRRAPSAK